jgi:integrase
MASIEDRANDHRVVWRQGGLKQWEKFATRAEAEDFAAMVKAHGDQWPYGWVKGHGFTGEPSTAPTFTAWAARSIASRARANDRTRHDYLRDLERHITPTFGPMQLDRITPEMVGQWLIGLKVAGVAPKTVKNLHGLASSVMQTAVKEGLCSSNPFRGAMGALPSVRQEEMVFLTRGEFDTLVSKVPEFWRALVLLLGLTGLRWSEATALRVGDIDPLARRLTVTRAWKRTPDNYFVIGEPKSRRSRRTITIPNTLLDALLPLIAARPDDDLLFLSPQGRPVRHANFRQRVWLPAVRAMQRCPEHADSPTPCRCPGTVSKSPRIHDARHSHISWLIAAGIDLMRVQRRAGHESIITTTERYGHLVPETDDEISNVLDGEPRRALLSPDAARIVDR